MRSPAERPLSPHLQVYRMLFTMVVSMMHRVSGLFLSGCAFLFVAWLGAAAISPEAYACVTDFLTRLPMRIVLVLALAAFWYHLFAGLRHLSWDAGYGFEKASARRSGAAVVLLAAAAFAATLVLTPAGRWVVGAQ
jgi:succinate dehydrogenase / fumarate reductase cytochrome b subunit